MVVALTTVDEVEFDNNSFKSLDLKLTSFDLNSPARRSEFQRDSIVSISM